CSWSLPCTPSLSRIGRGRKTMTSRGRSRVLSGVSEGFRLDEFRKMTSQSNPGENTKARNGRVWLNLGGLPNRRNVRGVRNQGSARNDENGRLSLNGRPVRRLIFIAVCPRSPSPLRTGARGDHV